MGERRAGGGWSGDGELHGVRPGEEHGKRELLRDVRPPATRLADALLGREGYVAAGVVGVGLMLWAPQLVLVVPPLLFLLCCARRARTSRDRLPMRVPVGWKGYDFGDPRPDGGFRKPRGAFYLGNDMDGGAELWIARADALTHTLVLGTTGSGKTEALVSLAFNYLAQGSGLLYVDPKAAPKLAVQIYTMCRILGRDDDFLLLSYTADRRSEGASGQERVPVRQSNSQNPFSLGTANQLMQLLFALMPEEGAGSNSIFANNAQTLISGLLFVLVELRDRGETGLSIGVIRRYLMSLSEIDALARRTDISEKSILALRAGLATVGWNMDLPLEKQPRSFSEQYGYARAYFGRALSLLVDNYGRIFMTARGEVDTVDVITSRRVYVTLIPSMDKDPKELRNLGQLCLSSVRNACAVGLGERVQGRVGDVIGALPTDAPVPFGVVVDEYAAIETPGFEILLTQGRGLGMAVTVASQDFAGIRRASEHAAEQIVSNCKVKIFMSQEDPRQTYELVRSLAGEAWVHRTGGWTARQGMTGATWTDSGSVSVERLSRVDFRDLQKQVEGQMTVFFKGGMYRARVFHASPPLRKDRVVRIHRFLKLREPSARALVAFTPAHARLSAFFDRIATPEGCAALEKRSAGGPLRDGPGGVRGTEDAFIRADGMSGGALDVGLDMVLALRRALDIAMANGIVIPAGPHARDLYEWGMRPGSGFDGAAAQAVISAVLASLFLGPGGRSDCAAILGRFLELESALARAGNEGNAWAGRGDGVRERTVTGPWEENGGFIGDAGHLF